MADKDQGKSELFGEGLPGTGGDFIDPGDVEGHRKAYALPTGEGGTEEGRARDYMRRAVDDSQDDVEGHLYTGGPSTQGEFVKRAPGANPHGDV